MAVLFVLLPRGVDVEQLFAAAPEAVRAARRDVRLVTYGPVDDRRHLLSLVRARRDRLATRSLRGLLACIAAGAALGLLVNGVLDGVFGMFGGLFAISLPLGFVLGAFLGGFTAAMTGTEVAIDEVQALAQSTTPGAVLLQVSSVNGSALAAVRSYCAAQELQLVTRG
jgi:hypothetical protein